MNILYNKISKNLCNLTKYYLKQTDFDNGTLLIKKPGHYILTEDISFNPINDKPSYELKKKYKQFFLGWFAAICICCDNIILDLNGKEIKQDLQFYVKQRFFMTIELADSPFIPNQGPVNNGLAPNKISSSNYCLIKNGKLGLTSHCGIHGNNNHHIIIQNLNIYNFEFSGICLNNLDHSIIKDCKIYNSFDKVFLNGNLSIGFNQVVLLEQLMNNLFNILNKCEINNVSKFYTKLNNLINNAQLNYINKQYQKIPKIFFNKSGLPDGSTVNGIQITSKGASIHNFLSVCCPNTKCVEALSYDIYIDNIKIQNLKLNTNETIHYSTLDNKKIIGTYGHIIEINTKPNILTQIDLLINSLKLKYPKLSEYIKVTTYIPNNIVQYIHCHNSNIQVKYYYGFDIMGHINKGVIGIRIDGTKRINITNTLVRNLFNYSKLTKMDQHNKFHIMADHNMGTDNDIASNIYGIVISKNSNTNINNSCVDKMNSKNGKVYKIFKIL